MQNDLRRWMTVAQQMVLNESAKGWEGDPHVQFHLSIEPDLIPGKPFSEQQRTVSADGARGAALGDGIYTTRNPQYWLSQLAYEGVGEVPRYVYFGMGARPVNRRRLVRTPGCLVAVRCHCARQAHGASG